MQLAALPGLSYAQGCAMMLAKQDHAKMVMAQMPDDCHGAKKDQSDDGDFPAELLCDCCQDDLRPTNATVMPADDGQAMDNLLFGLLVSHAIQPSNTFTSPHLRDYSSDPPSPITGRWMLIHHQSFLI